MTNYLVVSQVVSDRLNIENTRESTHQLLFDLPLRNANKIDSEFSVAYFVLSFCFENMSLSG